MPYRSVLITETGHCVDLESAPKDIATKQVSEYIITRTGSTVESLTRDTCKSARPHRRLLPLRAYETRLGACHLPVSSTSGPIHKS